MQTFVIGGRGLGVEGAISGLFYPSISIGCSCWNPHVEEGMEESWRREGKVQGGGKGKRTVIKYGVQTQRQKKMREESSDSPLFSVMCSPVISLDLLKLSKHYSLQEYVAC